MTQKISAVFFISVLCGCAHHVSVLDKLESGMDEQTITSTLGAPEERQSNSDGSLILHYSFADDYREEMPYTLLLIDGRLKSYSLNYQKVSAMRTIKARMSEQAQKKEGSPNTLHVNGAPDQAPQQTDPRQTNPAKLLPTMDSP